MNMPETTGPKASPSSTDAPKRKKITLTREVVKLTPKQGQTSRQAAYPPITAYRM